MVKLLVILGITWLGVNFLVLVALFAAAKRADALGSEGSPEAEPANSTQSVPKHASRRAAVEAEAWQRSQNG